MQPKGYIRLSRAILGVLVISIMAISAVLPLQRAHAAQTLYFVKPGGTDNSGTCDSWAHACELRWGLALANLASAVGSVPVQVWVAAGTYRPAGAPGTDRAKSFQVLASVSLYGGFAGTETLLSQRNPAANISILSGDIGSLGIVTDNSYHVLTVDLPSGASALVDGVRVVAGRADGLASSGNDWGGGIYIQAGSPTLRNLIVSGNYASIDGGGLVVRIGSSAALNNVTFNGNAAGSLGGGVFAAGNSLALTNVVFSGNIAAHTGGGIFHGGTSATLTNVVFDQNMATDSGGGMSVQGNAALRNVTFSNNSAAFGGGLAGNSDTMTLTNVTFYQNMSTEFGGGMCSCSTNSNETLTNVTFSANIGGGLFVNGPNHPVVRDGLFWADSTWEVLGLGASITNSVVQGGCPLNSTCSGLITTDPKLGSLQNNGGFSKTMALGAGSSAIDTGNNATCAPKDQRGVVRPQGAACDIGAYEVRAASFASTAAYDGWVLESSENSSTGGSLNSTNATLLAGDDAQNRQLRSFLSFGTGTLPDTATVVLAKLRIRQSSIAGAPFTGHGRLLADLARPYFGAEPGLVLSDFQGATTTTSTVVNSAGIFASTPVSGWYTALLSSTGQSNINKTGSTQFRVRFGIDDDNDLTADQLAFFSGNYLTTPAYQPRLVVYYNP